MGKKVKVVFDTNVWVSIFMKKVLSQEFSRILSGETNVYITNEIMTEISKVLLYPRIAEILQVSGVNSRGILRTIATSSTIVNTKIKLHIIEEDPADNKILECALTTGADIIVTGDKHLLKLGKFRKTRILTPRDFLDNLS